MAKTLHTIPVIFNRGREDEQTEQVDVRRDGSAILLESASGVTLSLEARHMEVMATLANDDLLPAPGEEPGHRWRWETA